MTSSFYTYFVLGIQHILDWNGYDHVLFLVALCATFAFHQWKPLLLLLTAFTLGHSITLALAALDIVHLPSALVEILIPITILVTIWLNLQAKKRKTERNYTRYALATGFGLVHGLGFSTFFKSLLGKEASIVQPLFAFNVGIEVAQIIVVAVTVTLSVFLFQTFAIRQRDWNLFVAGAVASLAVKMILERLGTLFGG
jgi:HupE / UreJ protein